MLPFSFARSASRVAGLALTGGIVYYLSVGLADVSSIGTIETVLDDALVWLRGVFDRIANLDLRMTEIDLADLRSASDWADALRSVFGAEADDAATVGVFADVMQAKLETATGAAG